MLITCLQHTPLESPGCISDWARERGHGMQIIYPAKGERLPEPQSAEWLIVLGGPMGVHDEYDFPWLREEKACIERALIAGVTVLGICLGAQFIAHVLGAKVTRNRHSELGWFPVLTTPEAPRALPVAATKRAGIMLA